MRKQIKYFLYIFGCCAILASFSSCSEDKVGQTPTDNVPPAAVSDVNVVPTPGGAEIYYVLPNETDISYVLCEYTKDGETKRTRSSVYNDHVTIEGFLKEESVPFTIYVVDHSENKSKGYSSSFTPQEAPISSVYKTITMSPTFGGALVQWKNPSNAIIGAFLMAKNDDGDWEEFDLYYSSLEDVKKAIRGYDDAEREFGVMLVDKFGNYSDTLKNFVTPLFEKELDKSKFLNGHLQGDNYTSHNSRPIEYCWDGTVSKIWHSSPTAGFIPPQYFTIDLGVYATLSRFMLFDRTDSFYFCSA